MGTGALEPWPERLGQGGEDVGSSADSRVAPLVTTPKRGCPEPRVLPLSPSWASCQSWAPPRHPVPAGWHRELQALRYGSTGPALTPVLSVGLAAWECALTAAFSSSFPADLRRRVPKQVRQPLEQVGVPLARPGLCQRLSCRAGAGRGRAVLRLPRGDGPPGTQHERRARPW